MPDPIRVAVIGATGYTAAEAVRLISRHPAAEVTVACSRSGVGDRLDEIHRTVIGHTDVVVETTDPAAVARRTDVAFCCLPHGASAETVRSLVDAGLRVVDFSADFRLSDRETYERWYGVTHPWPERIGRVPYGMPEFFADTIATADVVANPGCYPTSAILPLAPLARRGRIEPDDVIVDSKSGVSGAGRSPKLGTLYAEVNESIAAYAVGTHRHGPEIDDLVGRISGATVRTVFTPHLTPMTRGILSTIYVRPAGGADASTMLDDLRDAYASSPMVHVVDELPATGHVAGSNAVHIAARPAGDRVVLVCAIDNLVKGASGAAVQNMNVMFGLDAATGLLH